jgi:hypothetical protein
MRRNYDFSKGRRGAILKVPPGKTRITIRIDDDLLAWFRQQVHDAGGGNYQTLINDALRQFIDERTQPLAAVLRGVLREELARYGSSRRRRTERPNKALHLSRSARG